MFPQIQPITLEINGMSCGIFTRASATISIEQLSGAFQFRATARDNLLFPINLTDTCRVLINNTPVINGYVERISIYYDHTSHNIIINGRDKTCDLVDSTIGGNLTFKAPISLIDVTKKVLSSLNITNIKVSSNVELAPFKAGEIISPEFGMGAFDFIKQYAEKRQVLIVSDGDGNIVFDRSGTSTMNTSLLSSSSQYATVKSATAEFDTSKRFNKYIVVTQTNPSGVGSIISDFTDSLDPEKSTHVVNSVTDEDIRTSRVKYMQMETSTDDTDLVKNRALWELNRRRCDGFKYTATVYGFTAIKDGVIWFPNKLVNVVDDYCDLGEPYLLSEVTFDYDLSSGSTTTLKLVDKDSFTIKNIMGKERQKKKKHSKGRGGQIFTGF